MVIIANYDDINDVRWTLIKRAANNSYLLTIMVTLSTTFPFSVMYMAGVFERTVSVT